MKGADPAESKKLARGAMTIEELCREYLAKAEAGLILPAAARLKARARFTRTPAGLPAHHPPDREADGQGLYGH